MSLSKDCSGHLPGPQAKPSAPTRDSASLGLCVLRYKKEGDASLQGLLPGTALGFTVPPHRG